jgi:hypothetical protein
MTLTIAPMKDTRQEKKRPIEKYLLESSKNCRFKVFIYTIFSAKEDERRTGSKLAQNWRVLENDPAF